jgi:DNA-binding transcriptional MerR regulator
VDKAPEAFRTISEVADELDVPQHVLRFWETRFPQIKPMKRGGGRRYYRPEDVDLVRGIRHLLYGEGYTIRGVQRLLKDNGIKFVQAVWRPEAPRLERPPAEDADSAGEAAAIETPDAEAEEPVLHRDAPASNEIRRPTGAGRDTSFRTTKVPQPSSIPQRQPPEIALDTADAESPPQPPTADAVQYRALMDDDRARLQAALHELGECRRLLDAALKDE